jgi:hypothetical protein
MGTRIHVFLNHDLPRFDDTAETLARLSEALPAALAVRAYWDSADPDGQERYENWEPEPINRRRKPCARYDGPGSLFLAVTPAAARIFTGGRWRGFLSIAPLREVHLTAFRAIARALHSPKLALCHDSLDAVEDVFYDGGTQEECIAKLRSEIGDPQPSVEWIAPKIEAMTEHGVPDVWFLDEIEDSTWRQWVVKRQDDNGNRFVVQTGLGQEEAEQLVKEFESRGHKQVYWAEPEME